MIVAPSKMLQQSPHAKFSLDLHSKHKTSQIKTYLKVIFLLQT